MHEQEIRFVLALEEIQHSLTFDTNFDILGMSELSSSSRGYFSNYSKGTKVWFNQNPHRINSAFDYVRFLAIWYRLSLKMHPGVGIIPLDTLIEDICDAICVVDKNLQALCKEVKSKDILRCRANIYFAMKNVPADLIEVLDVKYLADDCIKFGRDADSSREILLDFYTWDEEMEHRNKYLLRPEFLMAHNLRSDKRLWTTIDWLENEVSKVCHGYVHGLSVINTAKLLAGGFKPEGK